MSDVQGVKDRGAAFRTTSLDRQRAQVVGAVDAGQIGGDTSGAVENGDDQGGYPSEESLQAAFEAIGFRQVETV